LTYQKFLKSPKNNLKIDLPKVFGLKLVVLDASDDGLAAVRVVGEDAANAVLVVVQRVRRHLVLQG
jgi:hypothetical protein